MRAALSAALVSCGVLFSGVTPAQEEVRGKEHYTLCASCHGEQGEGSRQLQAPLIGGLSEWYLLRQTRNFHKGIRGGDPRDELGTQVRLMIQTLESEEALADVAAYIAGLDPEPPEPTVEGDVERGKQFFAPCSACHGTNAQGNEAMNAPRLAGQSDWYLVRQLEKFKEGIRGTHQADTFGQQMRPMAMTLPDEQAIRDVVAYINTLGNPE